MEESSKSSKIYRIIIIIIITACISSFITAIAINKVFGDRLFSRVIQVDPAESEIDLPQYLEKIKATLEKEYLGEINEEDLINGAIKGYVDGLGDPYTVYFTKSELEEFETSTEGNYVGIGIYMSVRTSDNSIIVLSPIKGSPAEKAGIKPGDIITKVDGIEYSGSDMDKASNDIKGKEGTKVSIEINRDGKTLNFEVERKNIDIAPVESKILEKDIGYISLPSFDNNCGKEVKEKLKEFEDKKIDKVILDLRDNGGGLVDEALEILELFTNKGDNLLITTNKDKKEKVYKSTKDPETTSKLVVLINENSASASEIVSGTLKDLKRATLVGKNTYGKGVIQTLLEISDGAGLKVTVEEYFTAGRNKINEVGIKPDIEIKDNQKTEKDEQLNKAIEILKK